ATHREIERGLLGVPLSAAHDVGVLGALRSFTPQSTGSEAALYREQDVGRAGQVRRLREAVADRLTHQQMLRYDLAWSEGSPAFDDAVLAAQFLGLLRPKLEAVMDARSAAREALAATGHDAAALANAAFAAERAAHVVGRADELSRLTAYLTSETE